MLGFQRCVSSLFKRWRLSDIISVDSQPLRTIRTFRRKRYSSLPPFSMIADNLSNDAPQDREGRAASAFQKISLGGRRILQPSDLLSLPPTFVRCKATAMAVTAGLTSSIALDSGFRRTMTVTGLFDTRMNSIYHPIAFRNIDNVIFCTILYSR